MTHAPDTLYAVRIQADRPVAEAIDAILDDSGEDAASVWFDADTDRATVSWFCPTHADATRRLEEFEALAARHPLPGPWQGEIAAMPREDWAESWKRFFHAEKVAPRVWIRPSWESCDTAPGEIEVEIDPGMSFGTGQHATTRACLLCLDDIAGRRPPGGLIDAGCGSGILAIAATKLGYAPVAAFDNDAAAVEIAADNARRNGVADRIGFSVADLASLDGRAPAETVVANILAPVLIEHAARLTAALAPAPVARLILSGLLVEQAPAVLTAFERQALVLETRHDVAGWATLCLRRATP